VVTHLYHLAQQQLRYEIIKNRLRHTKKRLYFDLRVANFFSGWGRGLCPQTPMTSGGRGRTPVLDFQNLTKMIHYCHSNGNNFLSVRKLIWWFRTLHSAPFFSRFHTINSAPVQKVVRKCPPLLATLLFQSYLRNHILRSNHSLFSEFWCETRV